MAFEAEVFDFTFKNSASSSGTIAQFAPVFVDNTTARGAVPQGDAKAGGIIGVNQSEGVDPNTGALTAAVQNGQSMQVRMHGISRCVAAGAITAGAEVYATSNGQVTATSGANMKIGVALEAAGGSGDVIAVFLEMVKRS